MNGLLTVDDYPPQEPVSAKGQAYRDEAARRGAGATGRDVPYGDDIHQRIALFVPPKPNGTLFAYMHGGGWTSGYKEMMAFLAPGLMQANIIFASVGYRLAPAHVFPAGREDAAAAVKWLHDNAAAIGADPKRLFIGGHSAGGHYAALIAVTRGWRGRFDLPSDVIRGCVAVSGVFDLTGTSGLSMRPRFLGAADSGNDAPASPLMNIEIMPPPFLIAHGDLDFPHLIPQAERMERALQQAGGDVERVVLAGCDHFTGSLAAGDPELLQPRIVKWLAAH